MPLVTKAADERLNKLNFQMASLRFGMATEIAAQLTPQWRGTLEVARVPR